MNYSQIGMKPVVEDQISMYITEIESVIKLAIVKVYSLPMLTEVTQGSCKKE
jgi:hypothetical protein